MAALSAGFAASIARATAADADALPRTAPSNAASPARTNGAGAGPDVPVLDLARTVPRLFAHVKYVSSRPGPLSVDTVVRVGLGDIGKREASPQLFLQTVRAYRAKILEAFRKERFHLTERVRPALVRVAVGAGATASDHDLGSWRPGGARHGLAEELLGDRDGVPTAVAVARKLWADDRTRGTDSDVAFILMIFRLLCAGAAERWRAPGGRAGREEGRAGADWRTRPRRRSWGAHPGLATGMGGGAVRHGRGRGPRVPAWSRGADRVADPATASSPRPSAAPGLDQSMAGAAHVERELRKAVDDVARWRPQLDSDSEQPEGEATSVDSAAEHDAGPQPPVTVTALDMADFLRLLQ